MNGMLREVRLLTTRMRSLARAGLPGFITFVAGARKENGECRQDYRVEHQSSKRLEVGCSNRPFDPSEKKVAQFVLPILVASLTL
jgi:hypothetical protein